MSRSREEEETLDADADAQIPAHDLATKPPVDLYCYYLFLQRESSEDVLDFWLDVQQHENLCRAYFNDLRKQSVRVSNDWPRYYHYAKVHGSIYGKATGIHQGDADDDEDQDEDEGARGHDLLSGGIEKEWRGGQQSGYAEKIDQDDDDEDGRHQQQQRHPRGTTSEDSSNFNNSNNNTQDNYLSTPDQQADPRSTMRTPSPTFNGPSSAYPLSPTLRAMYPHDADDHLDHHPSDDRPRPSSRRSNSNSHKRVPSRQQQQPLQPYIPRSTAINRTDLIASAERIYSRYLLPGSAKEVYLPTSLRIESFPISSSTLPSVHHPSYDVEADAQARVPDMFHRQKEFVYQQMARDSFPRFVRAKVWGNLTSTSSLIRLIGGLFALWAGLATAFSFIFLDVAPRSTRLWVSC